MSVSSPLETGIAARLLTPARLEERYLGAIVSLESSIGTASEFVLPQAASEKTSGHRKDRHCPYAAAAIYRVFMGCDPANASIEDVWDFDQHVLASILTMAAIQGGAVAERAGLPASELTAMIAQRFPSAHHEATLWGRSADPIEGAEEDEVAMVRDLLLANCSTDGEIGSWLAAMIARRAIEPNHLWEDLGLRDRSELTRLLSRHFAPLAARNTNNMRWKRFFYRALCENDGLVMCSTPVCSRCGDFDLCFGDESGESRMAYQRRSLALKTASLWELENATGQTVS